MGDDDAEGLTSSLKAKGSETSLKQRTYFKCFILGASEEREEPGAKTYSNWKRNW